MRIRFFAAFLMLASLTYAQQRVSVSGFVMESGSNEQLPGANVYFSGTSVASVTNTYGFYSITVPASDSAMISFSYIGYEKFERKISLKQNTKLDVVLSTANQLKEVVVSAKPQDLFRNLHSIESVKFPIEASKTYTLSGTDGKRTVTAKCTVPAKVVNITAFTLDT